MGEGLLGKIITAVIQGLLSALFGEVRARRIETERNDAVVGHALEKQAAEQLERRNTLQRDMADAQVRAPRSRDALARRLRLEAAAETAPPGDGVSGVAGRGEGP